MRRTATEPTSASGALGLGPSRLSEAIPRRLAWFNESASTVFVSGQALAVPAR